MHCLLIYLNRTVICEMNGEERGGNENNYRNRTINDAMNGEGGGGRRTIILAAVLSLVE